MTNDCIKIRQVEFDRGFALQFQLFLQPLATRKTHVQMAEPTCHPQLFPDETNLIILSQMTASKLPDDKMNWAWT